MKTVPLHTTHVALGARFKSINNWQLPECYSTLEKELSYVNSSVALLDRSYLEKIILSGNDATDLLNRISTNDMNELIAGAYCNTLFCTPKGRIVDYAKVMKYDNSLLLISSFLDSGPLQEWINRFIILEDAQVHSVTQKFVWLTLIGPKACDVVKSLSEEHVQESDDAIWLYFNDIKFPALINTNFKEPAYNFCLPVKQAQAIFNWIYTAVQNKDGGIIGDAAFQLMRMESGMPDWGSELNENYNPHEARLLEAVSFTKGCYTGQEVVARLDTYDKVQKYLMVVHTEDKIEARLPLDIQYNGSKVGQLTSFKYNSSSKKGVGLAYVKKNIAVIETKLSVEILHNNKAMAAQISVPPIHTKK